MIHDTQPIQAAIAKADDDDIRMAIALSEAFDDLLSSQPIFPRKMEGKAASFDRRNPDHCQRVMNYLLDLSQASALVRVTAGMAVLLDPNNKLVDPDQDILAGHPDRANSRAELSLAAITGPTR